MTVNQVRLINQVIAEDKTIPLPSGCRQGDCSACVTKIIESIPFFEKHPKAKSLGLYKR